MGMLIDGVGLSFLEEGEGREGDRRGGRIL